MINSLIIEVLKCDTLKQCIERATKRMFANLHSTTETTFVLNIDRYIEVTVYNFYAETSIFVDDISIIKHGYSPTNERLSYLKLYHPPS